MTILPQSFDFFPNMDEVYRISSNKRRGAYLIFLI